MRVLMIPAVVVVLSAPAAARAQPVAETLDQLRFVLEPGADIRVVGIDGKTVAGTFETISGASLALTVHGARVSLEQDRILCIRQRRDDSLGNGARNGFIVGAALGLLGGLAIHSEGGSAAFIPATTLMYGGIGAGVGVGIDALIRSERTVYDAHARHASLSIAPVVVRTRKGVAVTVGF